MDHPVEDGPMARPSLGGSEELLIPTAAPRGASNLRALKIAGLTTLVCLLVCSQVLTAYMVASQKKQIRTLHTDVDKLRGMLNRPSSRAMASMKLPISTLNLLEDFDPQTEPKTIERPKPQNTVEVEKELVRNMPNSKLPNEPSLVKMESEKHEKDMSEWKTPVEPARPTTQLSKAPVTKSKCQKELESHLDHFGSYKPECDEHGGFVPVQCWHGTGFCWCVDDSGAVINGTVTRGRPACKAAETEIPLIMDDF